MSKKPKVFPRHIDILGRRFKIKQVKSPMYQGQAILGLCNFPEKTIYLEKMQSDHDKRATLIHECAHAFLHINGMDQKLSESENEIYCQLLTAFYEDMVKAIE